MRAEKLPAYADLTGDNSGPPKKPQTIAEQEIALDGLFLAMGGSARELQLVKSSVRDA